MVSSVPSQCALSEFQKTALLAAMSVASQLRARTRRSAMAYQRQTMEIGLKCGRRADDVGSLELGGMTVGGGDTSNNMGDQRGEAKGEVLVPILKLDVLGLVCEKDDGSGRVGSPGEEQYGDECAGRVEHG
jgi:hypothetical protein